ncbi:hypothetical protein [Streptomyces sp. NPDC054887]
MTSPPLLLARCAAARGCFPPPRREIETGRGLAGALLVQGALTDRLQLGADRVRSTGRGDTGDPALAEAPARLGRGGRRRAPAVADSRTSSAAAPAFHG